VQPVAITIAQIFSQNERHQLLLLAHCLLDVCLASNMIPVLQQANGMKQHRNKVDYSVKAFTL